MMKGEEFVSYGSTSELERINRESSNSPSPVLDTELLSEHEISSPSFPPLTDKEIKQACRRYASERWCHFTRFVDSMTLAQVNDRIAYHYTLESFTERRFTVQQIKPYYGDAVDSPDEPVEIWDIPVTPREMLPKRRKITTVNIPYASYVLACSRCNEKGTKDCKGCTGKGGSGVCDSCTSNQEFGFRPCNNCRNTRQRCELCHGLGTELCKTCEGQGKMQGLKILIVSWETRVNHFVTDTMGLPEEEIINKAEGNQLFSEEAEELKPISNAPHPSIMEASANLLNSHRPVLDDEVIRKQKHTLRAVPFTEVKYRWRNDMDQFYVYGLQKNAYFEDYPQKYCCCCTVM